MPPGERRRRRQDAPDVGPPWCNGSTQAFGALRSLFESGGRSTDGRRPGYDRATVPRRQEAPRVSSTRPAAVLVLAAGEGTRMKSATPKVLHRIGGRSLLGHALAPAPALEPAHLVVVVRHERDQVAEHVAEIDETAVVADQDEVKGTGRAVACGLSALSGRLPGPLAGTVVVTYGDVPLLSADTLRALVERHEADAGAVTVLTAEVADPTGYGRILRDADGDVAGIVEHKDADDAQRAVREINSGIYAFDAAVLADALGRIRTDNAQGEMYLTDVLSIARAEGRRVAAVT